MELFAIVIMKVDELYVRSLSAQIERELQLLHIVESEWTIDYEWTESHAFIRLEAMLSEQEAPTIRNQMMPSLAGVLADHIITDKESGILRNLLMKEFKYDAIEDLEAIEGYCKQSLHTETGLEDLPVLNSSFGMKRRKQVLVEQLMLALEESSRLSLDGFLLFRLQDYTDELREVAEYAIDEYLMDRQYQEFISLLQYFVYIQEAKIPVVHLIHKGGHEFVILNDRLELIDANEFDATFKLEVLEKDINFEDMIVSTLITVSPANIYIHTRDPEMTVIKTIRQIFEDRTTVCSYCRTCDIYLGEAKKQDQLSP
ncbi:putative sporulation protein YtxC [Paenibacillus aceris]|uniref:Sporulation protein YtxC n=1 Tax=Paenibacillus aceris TaxID=869555 RepID=A0ABS4HUS4_9BACL|nr:putative sporulation protein YtxC [Paenibacillus aceris]MBP1962392.1 putative sporulation protein YtxC [Paenibacillus aceris]NHW37207.1 putative sporulation protein YtxC [Paenibacillus aceris]